MPQVIEILEKTVLNDEKTKEIIGKLVRKEFDKTENEERAFELLQIAYKYNLPGLGEMIDDYSISDFKWFM